MRTNMKSQTGMTMTEMLVVMGIIGILFTVAVPSYRYVTNSTRMSAEVNGLLGDLQFARSEALREGRTVTVCISSTGTSCSSSTTYTWQSGWIVFSDIDNDGTVDANEPVLKVQKPFTGTDDFEDGARTVNQVRFNREGFALGLPNAGSLIVLHDSTSNQAWTRCLSISLVGMLVAQTRASNASCT
jgi:type IV fimbrial biogenesis protein FimT